MKHFRTLLLILLFSLPGLLAAQCDLSVMQIVHPVGDVCPDDSATLKCMILNNGDTPVSFSVANPLTVQAAVTGTNQGVYTQTIQTGSLDPGYEKIARLLFDKACGKRDECRETVETLFRRNSIIPKP